jgi:preprotein translocase SecE subunit
VAKTRAQRKAEQRRRAQQQEGRTDAELTQESRAQHDTQVGETGYELEAELAERGVPLEELTGKVDAAPEAPAPSRADVPAPAPEPEPADKLSRRAQRQAEKDRKAKAKESEKRRAPKAAVPQEKRQRGGVIGFFISCWAELKRVQWPDRETLIQASAITLVFITIMAAYLGVLDAVFNWLVQRII